VNGALDGKRAQVVLDRLGIVTSADLVDIHVKRTLLARVEMRIRIQVRALRLIGHLSSFVKRNNQAQRSDSRDQCQDLSAISK
jgi:hypothetical protein